MKNNIFTLLQTYSRKLQLLALLIFALLVRSLVPYFHLVPFTYDHGRDYLEIIRIIRTFDLTLLGPRASIPGLYFGPLWYYLNIPIYLLTNGNPTAPVWLMIGLVLVQIILFWKYFGRWPAVIAATTPLWLIISKSAWNPYPITLVTLAILIILSKTIRQKLVTVRDAAGWGLLASLGFHFSSAVSIFYLPLIIISLIYHKIKISMRGIFILCSFFALPFTPQALFEIRHDFSQTRSVIAYFVDGADPQESGVMRGFEVLVRIINELKIGVFPGVVFSSWSLLGTFQIVAVVIAALFGIAMTIKRRESLKFAVSPLSFIILPSVAYCFLHFSIWYVLGFLPAATILIGKILNKAPKIYQYLILCLYIATPLSILFHDLQDVPRLQSHSALLEVKIEAVDRIYELADGRNFRSYHFVPDIYDYSYQSVYFWNGMKGRSLPVEFGYAPEETAYIKDKQAILDTFKNRQTDPQTELMYLIIERNEGGVTYRDWIGRIPKYEIVKEVQLGDDVTIFETKIINSP